MTDVAFFLDLETRVWRALAAGDAKEDAALLAPDFLGVYATGFAGRDAHSGQLINGPTVAEFTLSDARLIRLGKARALLAYRANYRRTGAEDSEVMYVSSIWENRDGIWLNSFSQDTAESETAPV